MNALRNAIIIIIIICVFYMRRGFCSSILWFCFALFFLFFSCLLFLVQTASLQSSSKNHSSFLYELSPVLRFFPLVFR